MWQIPYCGSGKVHSSEKLVVVFLGSIDRYSHLLEAGLQLLSIKNAIKSLNLNS